MPWVSLVVAACASHWFSAVQSIPSECLVTPSQSAIASSLTAKKQSFSDHLYEQARAITVKIKAGRNGGSGILIQQQGKMYSVVTNRHVVSSGAPYVIQTHDGQVHPASLKKKVDFRGNDLAILQFQSNRTYAIATFGSVSRLSPKDPVIAAGYPLEENTKRDRRLLVTVGGISLIPKQAFEGGYQLGYTNLIRQGMSGGPVMNLSGEVVGINSLHAYPLWGDPYVFQDGSKPTQKHRSLIVQSSWAIPIDTFLCLAKVPVPSNLQVAARKSTMCTVKS